MRLLVLAVLVVTVGVAYCSLDSDWEAFKVSSQDDPTVLPVSCHRKR